MAGALQGVLRYHGASCSILRHNWFISFTEQTNFQSFAKKVIFVLISALRLPKMGKGSRLKDKRRKRNADQCNPSPSNTANKRIRQGIQNQPEIECNQARSDQSTNNSANLMEPGKSLANTKL